MKKIAALGLCLTLMWAIALAGSVDPPGPPSSGSGMYTLQGLYDYLANGTALAVSGSFQEPGAGPGPAMKDTREIGDAAKAMFDQCNAAGADVKSGKRFFCAQSGSWGVQTGTMSGQAGPLLKTGQTSSYQTGDDGAYQKGVDFSYSWDVGADTVKDNVTGLIWASSGTGAGCRGGSMIVWSSAIIWAEGLSFAGYTDWRLPNITELESLSLKDISHGSPYINTTYFPDTNPWNFYISSTSYPYLPSDYAMGVYYEVSWVYPTTKGEVRFVRAVRGGQ